MRLTKSATAIAAAACVAVVATAPAAMAGDSGTTGNLAGRWRSAALKMDGAGYKMLLLPTDEADTYDAKLHFIYQDGKRGSLARASVAAHGSAATMTFTGGSGESVSLDGTVGNDGSLYFPKCYTVLPLITKAQSPASCLFQESRSRR